MSVKYSFVQIEVAVRIATRAICLGEKRLVPTEGIPQGSGTNLVRALQSRVVAPETAVDIACVEQVSTAKALGEGQLHGIVHALCFRHGHVARTAYVDGARQAARER